MRILVCDDLDCEETVEAIREGASSEHHIDSLHSHDLKERLESFFDRVQAFIDATKNNTQASSPTQFDGYDIVFLDNNLSHLGIRGARLTAESIAGYIRAYSNSKYIISLNKNPNVDFDLSFLVGDKSTIADLALETDHLKNRALWTGKPDQAALSFTPWYWPALHDEPDRRLHQIEFVKRNLKKSVFKALHFDDQIAHYISRVAASTLSPRVHYDPSEAGEESIHQVSFLDVFLEGSRALPDRTERKELYGRADAMSRSTAREIIARVVAADIDLWFRTDLVAPQDALVDLPHLLVRMPFLLANSASDVDNWNRTLKLSDEPYGLEQGIYGAHLREARVDRGIWGKTPTFAWPSLRDDDHLSRLFFDSTEKWADAVFCEDLSQFRLRTSEPGEPPFEFEAEFEGSWTRRYVWRVQDAQYVPKSRFAK